MTTTELIELLKKHERGGTTGRPREVMFEVNDRIIDTDGIEVIGSGDGLISELYLSLPSAGPTLREQALMLLLNWAVECDFGYDNFPEQYERYKDEIENMSYIGGMIYIAEKEVERSEKGYGLQAGSERCAL